MLIRNEATGRLVDNNLNEQGERRMSIVQCYDIAHQINRAMLDAERALRLYEATLESRREWQDKYSETVRSVDTFLRWLGDNVRSHAIDNELCANYERFLSGPVAEYVTSDETSELSQNFAKTFVIYASRARMLTVKTYNTVNVVGHNVYDVGAEAARLADEQPTWRRNAEITEATPIHNYDECQERNESFARRGNYTTAAERGEYSPSVRYDETDDGQPDERPQYPRGGQRWTNPDNGVTFEWCSGCGQWEEV